MTLPLLTILLVVGTILNLLLPLAIVYLASVIKKRVGKDLIDKYTEAAKIAAEAAEAYFLNTRLGLSEDKKEIAKDIAKKLLLKDGICIKNPVDESLLLDVIESQVYRIKTTKKRGGALYAHLENTSSPSGKTSSPQKR